MPFILKGCPQVSDLDKDVSKTSSDMSHARLSDNPEDIQLDALLEIFWTRHDPTQFMRQGNDHGTQYRSAIFYYGDQQKKIINENINRVREKFSSPIVTEVTPAKEFWKAEEYHQCYFEKKGR